MNMQDAIIEILAALVGTVGFCILFHIRGRRLIAAAFGGMLSWALFLLLGLWLEGEVLRYFLVAVCTTLYSELMARALKTPTTTFCVVTLIPLIPGGALYETTIAAMQGDITVLAPMTLHTVELAMALSLGIILVTASMRQLSRHFPRRN